MTADFARAEPATRRRFAADLLNLTLAAPEVNRCGHGGKCGYDAGEWLPPRNGCWFASRVVAVKLKYGLTVDNREAAALEHVLSGCSSTEMAFSDGEVPVARKPVAQKEGNSDDGTGALGLHHDQATNATFHKQEPHKIIYSCFVPVIRVCMSRRGGKDEIQVGSSR